MPSATCILEISNINETRRLVAHFAHIRNDARENREQSERHLLFNCSLPLVSYFGRRSVATTARFQTETED